MTAYTFADAERSIVDYLNSVLAENVTTGFPTPNAAATFTSAVQVAWDGTPTVEYPVTERATVRVTAWAKQPTTAKALAGKVQGLVLSHPGDASVFAVHPLTGRLPGRDADTGLFFCSFTCRVSTVPTAVA